jgi:hypothetical protein
MTTPEVRKLADPTDPSRFAYVAPGAERAFGQIPVRRMSPMFSPEMRNTMRDTAMQQGAGKMVGGTISPLPDDSGS